MDARVLSVNVSLARPVVIKERKLMTAIGKRAVSGAVSVRPLGLEGDEPADLSVHGGISKAVYAYPSEHYVFWRRCARRQRSRCGTRHCRTVSWART